ncbi:hypothetical protein [Plesiocystis pacifica]|uniref:hypothetical protein n=1 Tax=Plesiocystis pacifica TaxID=191768 RepID=UPI0003088508|nr:hypothetical protein [Plesiocystis pacifica]
MDDATPCLPHVHDSVHHEQGEQPEGEHRRGDAEEGGGSGRGSEGASEAEVAGVETGQLGLRSVSERRARLGFRSVGGVFVGLHRDSSLGGKR